MDSRLRLIPIVLLPLTSCASASRPEPPPVAAAQAGTGESSEMQVVPLRFASAEELAKTLNDAFRVPPRAKEESQVRAGPPPRIVADPRTNSLVVQGSPGDVRKVLDLVAKLDRKVE